MPVPAGCAAGQGHEAARDPEWYAQLLPAIMWRQWHTSNAFSPIVRRPCTDPVPLRPAAVHFKLSKIPGREELMELLHDVLYKRKGQVGRESIAVGGNRSCASLFKWCEMVHDIETSNRAIWLRRLPHGSGTFWTSQASPSPQPARCGSRRTAPDGTHTQSCRTVQMAGAAVGCGCSGRPRLTGA